MSLPCAGEGRPYHPIGHNSLAVPVRGTRSYPAPRRTVSVENMTEIRITEDPDQATAVIRAQVPMAGLADFAGAEAAGRPFPAQQ